MATKAKTTTLEDVLGFMQGMDRKLDNLTVRVEALDKRVTVLEAKPELKTRIVQQGGNGQGPVARPAPKVVQRDPSPQDEGEDEAIQSGTWEKVIKTSRCYMVGVSKTLDRKHWKLKMYMRGYRRPATMVGFDGEAPLVEFMKEVWPEISLDTFDEQTFVDADQGKEVPPEFQYDGMHFLVDWFRTAPNWRGHTFINVEGVYPLGE